MKQLILAHCPLATAFQTVLKDITGKCDVYALDLESHVSPEDYEKQIVSVLALHPEQEWLIWVDMAGGTPFNTAAQVVNSYSAVLLSGVNLPVLLHFSHSALCLADVEQWYQKENHFGIRTLADWLGGVNGFASQD